jgi:hypothetical protein
MAALFLLLATVGGVVVGDLVLENTSVDDITVFNHTIHGVSEGLLLAMAAVLGLVVGLLVVLSAGTTQTRRARRKRLRAAERDLNRQVAEFQRDNTRLRRELARRDRPARPHLGEPAAPADPGSTPWAGATRDPEAGVPSRPLERHPEPLYEEARRAAQLRSHEHLVFPSTDDRARVWQGHEYARRS